MKVLTQKLHKPYVCKLGGGTGWVSTFSLKRPHQAQKTRGQVHLVS